MSSTPRKVASVKMTTPTTSVSTMRLLARTGSVWKSCWTLT
jgi:hypothetical protein